MRYFLFLLIGFSFMTSTLKAQIPIEVLVGDKQVSHDFFFFKDLDEKKHYSVFTQGRFTVDYENEELNTTFLATYLTRNITEKWGVSVGGASNGQEFNPLVALSYTHASKDQRLLINLFPSLMLGKQTSYELSGILIYMPKISEKWSSFNQLIFATNLTPGDLSHRYSIQQVRVGVDYKQAFQFGFGIDLNFLGEETSYDYSRNSGLFVRIAL
jgi:hypothetical protein